MLVRTTPEVLCAVTSVSMRVMIFNVALDCYCQGKYSGFVATKNHWS